MGTGLEPGQGSAPDRPAARRVLVAGIGNVFLRDDGFGVRVVRQITPELVPDGVDVADYGIRGVHLAYDLLGGSYGTVVLVDAAPLGKPPGTVEVLEVDTAGATRDTGTAGTAGTAKADLTTAETGETARTGGTGADGTTPGFDAHGLHPEAVLALLRSLGGQIDRVLVVGCQPAALDEGMDLSEPVAASVDAAARLVIRLARDEAAALARAHEPHARERRNVR
ncbi:hydrogenase maturation protease [Frankia saprophytica]|uniref:hydrogenase maturation protease n=1 Tax=Pseudofrankia saprophytica TaxID=298655 RepID=UPI0002EF7205